MAASEFVFFGEELNQRAPASVGVLYHPQSRTWVTGNDVTGALRTGHAVAIRQATETEMRRATLLAEMSGLQTCLQEKMLELLSGKGEERSVKVLERYRDAVFSVDDPIPLLDNE